MAAFTVPQAIVPVLAGHLADSIDPRRLLLAGEIGNAAVTLGIALAMRSDRLSLPLFCTAAFLLGITSATLIPSYGVVLLHLVDHDQILNLSVIRHGSSNLAWLVGALTGGMAVAQFGPAGAVFLDSATFAFVVVTLAALWANGRIPGRPQGSAASGDSGDSGPDVDSYASRQAS